MAEVKFYRGNETNLPSTLNSDSIYVTETGRVYLGQSGKIVGESLTKLEVGINCNVHTSASGAFGHSCVSGCKGCYILGINTTTKRIYISKTRKVDKIPITTSFSATGDDPSTIGWAANDIFSIVNNDKWDFCGKITSLTSSYIVYEPIKSDAFVAVSSAPSEMEDDDCSIYVPTKPNCGYATLKYGTFSQGLSSKAVGNYSYAQGKESLSYGDYAHTEGRGTQAGYAAHGEGYNSKATGTASHAQNWNTTASGWYATSMGQNTTASGSNSLAGGNTSEATKSGSFSYGYTCKSHGECALAFGKGCVAEKNYSISMGNNAKSSGINALSIGTTASAYGRPNDSGVPTDESLCSHIASGSYSVVLGAGCEANADFSMCVGRANYASSSAARSITMGYANRNNVAGGVILGSNCFNHNNNLVSLIGYGVYSDTTLAQGALVVGSYNTLYSDSTPTYFAVGAGSSHNSRNTIMRVTKTGIMENGSYLSNKYAPKSHTHSYLSTTSGGTVSGKVTINNDLNITGTFSINGKYLPPSSCSGFYLEMGYYNGVPVAPWEVSGSTCSGTGIFTGSITDVKVNQPYYSASDESIVGKLIDVYRYQRKSTTKVTLDELVDLATQNLSSSDITYTGDTHSVCDSAGTLHYDRLPYISFNVNTTISYRDAGQNRYNSVTITSIKLFPYWYRQNYSYSTNMPPETVYALVAFNGNNIVNIPISLSTSVDELLLGDLTGSASQTYGTIVNGSYLPIVFDVSNYDTFLI